MKTNTKIALASLIIGSCANAKAATTSIEDKLKLYATYYSKTHSDFGCLMKLFANEKRNIEKNIKVLKRALEECKDKPKCKIQRYSLGCNNGWSSYTYSCSGIRRLKEEADQYFAEIEAEIQQGGLTYAIRRCRVRRI